MRPALAIVILSVFASLFWVSAFITEAITKSEPNMIIVSMTCFIIAIATYLYIKKSKLYIALKHNNLKIWLHYVLFSFISYLLTIPIGGLIGYLYTYLYSLKFEPFYGETGLLIWILTLWLPLWWSPAIGIILGNYVYSKKYL